MEIQKQYNTQIVATVLFEAWVSEDMVIPPAVKIESNPVVGGHYRLHAESPDSVFVMEGEFKEVEWGKRLVYSWHWLGTEEVTTISVTFSDEEGQTIVNLLHSGFESEESLKNHDQGWDSYFDGLTAKIAGQ